MKKVFYLLLLEKPKANQPKRLSEKISLLASLLKKVKKKTSN